jgi:hypothetical protein
MALKKSVSLHPLVVLLKERMVLLLLRLSNALMLELTVSDTVWIAKHGGGITNNRHLQF